jgi:hypothetical protein
VRRPLHSFEQASVRGLRNVLLGNIEDEVVLGGEVAVPCHLQSAIAGLNPS